MKHINWLHLSDLHIKFDDEYNRSIVLGALWKDIKERSIRISPDLNKIDMVFITGDIAYHGEEDEYNLLKEQFFDPLYLSVGTDMSGINRIFIVPGNHDCCRKEVTPGSKIIAKSLKESTQINEFLSSPKDRELLFSRQNNYLNFTKKQFPSLCLNEIGFFYVTELEIMEGIKIAILGLNSSWLSYGGLEDKGRLVIGERQVIEAIRSLSNVDICFALMHHPFDWLQDNEDTQSVEQVLRKNCHFILHGHLHKPNVISASSLAGETIIVPAGSIYESRKYPNNYNFGRIDIEKGTGKIYLRRYNDERQEWQRDTFSTGDEKNGVVEFYLPKQLKKVEIFAEQATKPDAKISSQYYELGKSLQESYQYEKALNAYEKALERIINVQTNIKAQLLNTKILIELSLTCTYLLKFDRAFKYTEAAFSSINENTPKVVVGKYYYHEGYAYYKTGELYKALNSLEKAKNLFLEKNNKRLLSKVHDVVGTIYKDQGIIDSAIENYEISVGLKQEVNDIPGLAITYGNLGRLCILTKKYDRALEYFEEDLSISKNEGDIKGLIIMRSNIGHVLEKLKRYDESIESYEMSLQLSEQINDSISIGFANLGLSTVYLKLNITNKSKKYLDSAAEYFKDDYFRAHLYRQKAQFVAINGKLDEAYSICIEAANLFINSKNFQYSAECLMDAANLFMDFGRYGDAIELYRKVIDLAADKSLNWIIKDCESSIKAATDSEKVYNTRKISDEELITSFPFPISNLFYKYKNNLVDSSSMENFYNIIGIYEILLRYMASILICNLLRDIKRLANIDNKTLNSISKLAVRPSLGSWLALYREISRTFKHSLDLLIIPEIVMIFTQKNKKNRKITAILDEFVNVRNKMAHGFAASIEEYEIVRNDFHNKLVELLEYFSFLKNYRFIVIDSCHTYRDQVTISGKSLMGYTSLFQENKIDLKIKDVGSVDPGDIVIMNNKTSEILNLNSIWLFEKTNDIGADLCVYNGARKNSFEYISFFTGRRYPFDYGCVSTKFYEMITKSL